MKQSKRFTTLRFDVRDSLAYNTKMSAVPIIHLDKSKSVVNLPNKFQRLARKKSFAIAEINKI